MVWTAGWNSIISKFKDELTFEPYSFTVGLRSDQGDIAAPSEP